MISPQYTRNMARYNRWQNKSLYDAASMLNDAERHKDRGAFFRSIHGTLCHLLWGDQIWMNRFSGSSKPMASSIAASASMIEDWDELRKKRFLFDHTIVDWADAVDNGFLQTDLTWVSGALKKEVTKPVSLLVVHMFNHQTHHRGQVHAMLTAAGAKPDDTDLFALK